MIERVAEPTPKLSAILVVRNEAHCLERCLRSIAPIADEIIVLDAGSTDATVSIAHSFGARIEVTDWPGFGPQKNRALNRARGEWVLAIDADEHLTPQLAASIRAAIESPDATVKGYLIQFLATWCGKPVHFGAWAGQRHLRLFRRVCAQFTDDLVHERVICQPPYATLDGIMIHDTVATDDEAIEKGRRYAELGAQRLSVRGRGGLSSALLHSTWTLLRGFVVQGGFLDGTVGWKVAFACAKGTWLRYRIAGRQLATCHANRAAAGVWTLPLAGIVQSTFAAFRDKIPSVATRTFESGASRIGSIAISLALVVLVTALLLAIQTLSEQQHLIFGYLVPVAFVAFRYGSVPGIWLAIASDLSAAFFFYPPTFNIYVDDPFHVAELMCFTILALIVNYLIAESRRRFASSLTYSPR